MATEKELTTPEIRKLIKAHNVLMSINIPPKATRQQIFKILDDKGYMVNHVRKSIQRRYKNERKPNVTLSQADKILKKPEKTALQKQKAEESKAKKAEAQKKRERELKKEAVKKATKVPVKKPDVKKPMKPMKKEDEVRKARIAAPPIPKNVKGKVVRGSIGGKPQGGGRIETGTLNKGKVAKPMKKEQSNISKFDELLTTAVAQWKTLENYEDKQYKLKPTARVKFDKIYQSVKDGSEKRRILSIKIEQASKKETSGTLTYFGGRNLLIKFNNKDPTERPDRAIILPFIVPTKKERLAKERLSKEKETPKEQPLLLEDKKEGQVIKQPDKVSMKDKLIAKDRKGEADKKDAVKQRKEAKKPYKPSADSSIKELMFKLFDYFEKDKNKVGKTFKTVKEVNTAIGNVFSSIKGEEGDALASLGVSERKYFIRLMNSMLRNSSTEKDGVEVTKQSLKKYKGWYSATAFAEGKEAQRKKETAPARLEKKLLKAGSQLEDKPAIRAREKADKLKTQVKEEKKQVKKTGKPVVKSIPDTFDYEETSGYSTALKSALKQLYKLANSIINEINKLKPKDFVEGNQKLVFSNKYVNGGEDLSEDLDDDDLDIFNEVSEELDQELETTMSDIITTNRESTGWKPPIPKLSTLQAKYKKALAGGGSRKTLTEKLKAQIIKHYSASDVPK
jgi:hypothetical protein